MLLDVGRRRDDYLTEVDGAESGRVATLVDELVEVDLAELLLAPRLPRDLAYVVLVGLLLLLDEFIAVVDELEVKDGGRLAVDLLWERLLL